MLLACWLNGRPVSGIDPCERAFAYGDGLFTTLAVRAAQSPLLPYHWRRLQEGCQRLGINVQAVEQAILDFPRFLQAYPDCTAKIIISRGASGRGYLPADSAAPMVYFQAWPAAAPVLVHRQGISTGVLQQRLGLNPLLAGLKHLNRLEQVLLRQELQQQGWPEGVVCDLQGQVVEGVFSNLFVIQDDTLLTPALQQAGVAGVMRAYLLDWLAAAGHAVREQALSVADLLAADGLFFCNSLYGIWPVTRFDGTMRTAHPLTLRLQQHLDHVRITA